MTDDDRSLPEGDVAAMVRSVRPEWRVREASLAERGWTSLYRVVVDTPVGRRRCALKATPDGDGDADIGAEARIQAVVAARTDAPVPTVLGVVDEHEGLRSPYFLMEWLPGDTVPMREVGALPAATVRRAARQLGGWLGQLHGVDVDLRTFGSGVDHDGDPLAGGVPSGDPATLVDPEGHRRWADQLREWFAADIELLADSRFADLERPVRAELARRLEALPEGFAPVLGRVDHGWFNLLLDRDAGELSGVIDWGSRFAVPAGFDLAAAEFLLAGGWWTALPDHPDRRPLVRAPLLAGYREVRPLPPALDAQRACYHLSDAVRWAALLEDRVGGSPREVAADRLEEAAAGTRAALAAELDGP